MSYTLLVEEFEEMSELDILNFKLTNDVFYELSITYNMDVKKVKRIVTDIVLYRSELILSKPNHYKLVIDEDEDDFHYIEQKPIIFRERTKLYNDIVVF